jgi:hypothetical protein
MNLNATARNSIPSDHVHRSILLEQTVRARAMAEVSGSRRYTVRAADSDGHRSSARILVDRMYAWRGYTANHGAPDARNANRITLVASDHAAVVGTMTIGFDGPQGLFIDELFRQEVDRLRGDGSVLCEFTKLAMDGAVRSKPVLASLFHVAFIHAHEFHACDRILIEVNPRHVRFYQRMLGFEVSGPERLNPRVDALAVLLSLDLRHARAQIDQFGGKGDEVQAERSLYPYFFSAAEEAGIIDRLSASARPRGTAGAPGTADAT